MPAVTISLDGVRLTVEYDYQPEEYEDGYLFTSEWVEVCAVRVGADTQDVGELLADRLEQIEGLVLEAHHQARDEARAERRIAEMER